ncbi:unnamed protein product [Cyclocybe aegerita]|uniref:Major facilitator superfamily (MFS) profile domain-containing protein n=1 Tax=Cyclocybe aegerita TaxID=1973307 RepID=A0A8S0VYD2_CYCAE|nr:unnamed protein product [Cyclocybe aegerita]
MESSIAFKTSGRTWAYPPRCNKAIPTSIRSVFLDNNSKREELAPCADMMLNRRPYGMDSPQPPSQWEKSVKAQSENSIKEVIITPLVPVPVVEDVMDGGRLAWCTVIGGFLTIASTFGYANSFGVYQDFYTRSRTASASAISWVGSMQIFFIFAMSLPAGKLLDMGYFRITTMVRTFIYVFSLFMVSICESNKYYQIYLAQGLGMGIGAGLLYLPSITVQSHHWRDRQAFAMGIVAAGTSFGSIMFPIVLNELIKSSLGFRWGVRVSAFMVLVMMLAANVLMTSKKKLGSKNTTEETPKFNIKGIMHDLPFITSIICLFFGNWGIFFPYFYIQLFAIVHGLNRTTVFYLIAILNASAILGRILPNMLADRLGPNTVIVPTVTSCAVLVYGLLGISTILGMIIFVILYGFMSGAALSLSPPCFAALARHPSEVGVRFGIAFSLAAFGALIGNPITGELLGPNFTWNKPIIVSAVAFTASSIFIIISRQILVKRKGTQWV